jgi:uncharacterized protein (TIGR00369 family)
MLDSPPATSGFAQLVGFRLAAWREGYAEVELDLGPQHMNVSGAPHGGVLATLIDTAAGFAGCHCAVPGHKRRAMTLSLDTHFVGRAKTGSRLKCIARQTGGGRNIFFATAEVRDETGVLIAQGGGVFRYRGNSGDPRGETSDDQHSGDPA